MKVCLINVGWQKKLAIPIELSGFLPQMYLVEVDGYGSDAKLFRSADQEMISFVDAESILPVKAAAALASPAQDPDPPELPDPSVETYEERLESERIAALSGGDIAF